MIYFLNWKRFVKGLKPVLTTEMLTRTGEFHQDGLFSEVIFGPVETPKRKTTFSYINLNVSVVHPSALKLLLQLDKRIELFLSGQQSFSLDGDKNLVLDEKGSTGINDFIKMFPIIKFRGGTDSREKYIKKLEEANKEGTLFINVVPVIPPEQRPLYQDEKGQWVIDNLNNYYINILKKSLNVKTVSKSGPLFDLLNYEVQKSVTEHDDYIRALIQKKSGLIRSQILGKRTDFSGRAVITPGPDLKVNEIGIPFRLATSIFEPFILHRLLYSGRVNKVELANEIKTFTNMELSVDSVKKVFKLIRSADKIPDSLFELLFRETEVAMMNRVVLAKRDPVLHAESVRAFYAKLVRGNTIQICTLQVGGFNADFDGDTMAIFHPITREAQDEAKEKMLRSQGFDNMSSVIFSISKEMVVGLYIITKDVKLTKSAISVSDEDLETANDPYIPVKYRGQTTTIGKALFNSCFPKNFPYYPGQINKSIVNKLIRKIIDVYGQDEAIQIFYKVEKLGFKFATIMAPSISLDDLQLPTEVYRLKEKLGQSSPEEGAILLEKMVEITKKHLEGTGLYDLIDSGATKGWDQPIQILVAKGIIADPSGKVLSPIKGSFSDGLTPTEYFKASQGARKGIIDRVLNTADTGYMSRKLAYVLNSVEIHNQLKDCKTDRTLSLRLTKGMPSRLRGRFILRGDRLEEFKESDFKLDDVIYLRSPVYCKSHKLCHTCYGRLLEKTKSPYAGIVAAQVIGERGTQLIMRTFHTGGAVKLEKTDIIQDILDNDPLIEYPKSVFSDKWLYQTDNQLVARKPCKITINTDEYHINVDLFIEDTLVWAKNLLAKVEFEDITFNLIIDKAVNMQVFNNMTRTKEEVILEYKENDTILEVPVEASHISAQIKYLERLLGGREIYKDVDHLFRKLYNIYGPSVAPDMDLVHLEVLTSHCLRDRTNQSIPARLGKTWDPVMINIKKIVFNTSFVQGLAFENINEAIRSGLVTEEPYEPSILEKVLTGELTGKRR
jgi:DNA-directed RNA polymerase beta' subunit